MPEWVWVVVGWAILMIGGGMVVAVDSLRRRKRDEEKCS